MESYYNSAKYIKSVVDIIDAPTPKLKEILFVGKSNVGKSSLINALTNSKRLAYTSKTPGHTKLLNYFLIENNFYFVDSPGYGFSKKRDKDYEFYGDMLEKYFDNNENLKLIVFLLDSRHEPTDDDLDFFLFLKKYNYKFVICMTKCDKLNQSEKSKINKNVSNKFNCDISTLTILPVSVKNLRLLGNLKETIDESLRGN